MNKEEVKSDSKVRTVSSSIEVEIGDRARTYSVGDFLNAVDLIVCVFQNERDVTDSELSDALEMYAKRLKH